MKYCDEFRDPTEARRLVEAIQRRVTRPWSIMEVCGGQTHGLLRFGIDRLLAECVRLVHGPGCPVCVTPLEKIERALSLARQKEVVLCSFGDMLRVPGVDSDLQAERAKGADVRIVYAPLDAVEIAEREPNRQVVFFAVGFETTAPANALAVREAARRGVANFSLLVSHVLVPPALEAILAQEPRNVDGFLAAGHVCSVMGLEEYVPLAREHRVPIVVTGFEPLDLLQGILLCIEQLETGRAEVENQYARAVRPEGNRLARALVSEVFEVVPRAWRGLGQIPRSGLGLRRAYADYDAERRFPVSLPTVEEPVECQSGLVLRGLLRPDQCLAFGVRCTPDRPLGAPMVSSEGACAAYHRYRREA